MNATMMKITTAFVLTLLALGAIGGLAGIKQAVAKGAATQGTVGEAPLSGELDPTFGNGGKVTLDLYTDANGSGSAIVLQPDGKMVVAGTIQLGTTAFGLIRFNTDGSPDLSFGRQGKVTTKLSQDNDVAQAVTLQSDGKIVVAGRANGGPYADFGLVRYYPDGSLDPCGGYRAHPCLRGTSTQPKNLQESLLTRCPSLA